MLFSQIDVTPDDTAFLLLEWSHLICHKRDLWHVSEKSLLCSPANKKNYSLFILPSVKMDGIFLQIFERKL